MLIIELTEKALKLSRDFADKVVGTNIEAYKRRGQSNLRAITEQIYGGKLAEFAVASVLKDCTEPDVEIYDKKKKSFSADLIWNEKQIHVKSQTRESAKKYGTSWSFQKQDRLIKQPTPEDLLALCVLDLSLNTVCLWGVFPATLAVPILKEPVVYQLRNTKSVLYWDDLREVVMKQFTKEDLNV